MKTNLWYNSVKDCYFHVLISTLFEHMSESKGRKELPQRQILIFAVQEWCAGYLRLSSFGQRAH